MSSDPNALLNWAYKLTTFISREFEVEEYNDYEFEELYHDYLLEDGEITEIYLGVKLNCEGYDTNPLKLIEWIENNGFRLHSTNVEWDRKTLGLSFKYEL